MKESDGKRSWLGMDDGYSEVIAAFGTKKKKKIFRRCFTSKQEYKLQNLEQYNSTFKLLVRG